MTKTTSHGITNYHADRKIYLQPRILEEFVGDDGELQYILDNGRTSPAKLYNGIWLPMRKAVQWKAKDTPIGHKQAKY